MLLIKCWEFLHAGNVPVAQCACEDGQRTNPSSNDRGSGWLHRGEDAYRLFAKEQFVSEVLCNWLSTNDAGGGQDFRFHRTSSQARTPCSMAYSGLGANASLLYRSKPLPPERPNDGSGRWQPLFLPALAPHVPSTTSRRPLDMIKARPSGPPCHLVNSWHLTFFSPSSSNSLACWSQSCNG